MKILCLKTYRPFRGRFWYVIVYNFAAWPARVLIARGWQQAAVMYIRQATSDEIAEQRQSTRMLAFRYETWSQIVEDEAQYGADANNLRQQHRSKK